MEIPKRIPRPNLTPILRAPGRPRVARTVAVDGRAVEVCTDGYARDMGPATAGMQRAERSTIGPITYGATDDSSIADSTRARMAVTTIINGARVGYLPTPRQSVRSKWHPDGRYQTAAGHEAVNALNARPPVPLGPGW